MKDGTDTLKDGADTLKSGTDTLKDGTSQLLDGAGDLKDGVGDLSDGVDDLKDGAKDLNDGAEELRDGMKEFDEEGIQKLNEAYEDNIEVLIDRLDAVLNADKAYKTFAGSSEGCEGKVKFIMETGAIEAKEE